MKNEPNDRHGLSNLFLAIHTIVSDILGGTFNGPYINETIVEAESLLPSISSDAELHKKTKALLIEFKHHLFVAALGSEGESVHFALGRDELKAIGERFRQVAFEIVATTSAISSGNTTTDAPEETRKSLEQKLNDSIFLHAMREFTAYSAMPGMTEEKNEIKAKYNFSFSGLARLLGTTRQRVVEQSKKIQYKGFTLHDWISGKGKLEALK